ncbi:MAG: SagB/ThcOx family dehydrogenase [Nitrospiria bacterium]
MRRTDQQSIAQVYHQKTKYYEAQMAEQQQPLNWDTQPSPFKAYHTEKKIDLSPYLPLKDNPFTGKPLEPIPEEEGYPFTLGALSRLLYFTNGVTGILRYPSGDTLAMRAAPTAGGLYPAEIYVAVRNCTILKDGIYNFQTNDHSLVLAWEGDFWNEFEKYCFDHEAIDTANLLVITTAIFQRSAWRYRERAYRRILLDTGHVLGNLTAYASEEGFFAYPIGKFVDHALNRLLFLEEALEGVLSVVALPQNPVRMNPSLRKPPDCPASETENEVMSPLLLQLHRGSSIRIKKDAPLSLPSPQPSMKALEKKYAFKETALLTGESIDWPGGLGQTILLRRSTRAFTGESFSREELASILEYGYGSLSPARSLLFSIPHLETYILAQRIDGLENGVYYYAPQSRELRLIYAGDFENQSWHFCLGQELARDAAALVIHTAHLENAMAQYGNRVYRYLHIDAGHIGERINLAAIRLGLGVSGIGGFYDDEVNALLGLPLEQIIVYITTLGQPHGPRRS